MFRVRTKHFCFDASCLLVNKTNKPLKTLIEAQSLI